MDCFQYMAQNGKSFWAENPNPDKDDKPAFPKKGPTMTAKQMDSGKATFTEIISQNRKGKDEI